ncbi:hypothetical protein CHS0354_022457 [Potamilus streckersoni]|uniref:GDP-fucose protein O-fucosyltransferase 1 n=1 Tax=Potamilus streckersoni TaxID=2493646 RepID=A0AAE0SXU5_9BIVA|nr:hypothetical protein CHS0354_022457 [Potamilus streckersoni]
MRYIFLLIGFKFFWGSCDEAADAGKMKQVNDGNLQWDERGYLFFCLCMGRFGNQADHFLGSLAFAKDINRTLVIPSWRTYKNIRFTEWFKLKPIQEYHRAVLAEDFMEYLAPQHWPPGNRTGFCFSYTQYPCEMKKGNPFGPYWSELGVDFDNTVNYNVGYSDIARWKKEFPPEKYPVLALKGAPAAFPVQEENRDLQRYLQWSDTIKGEAEKYINQNFPNQTFVGIHLRNGLDWENACKHVDGSTNFMSSPQCLGFNGKEHVTSKLCLPPKEEILRLTQKVVLQTGAKVVYVATDKYSMVKELEDNLQPQKVKVYHQDPWLPQIDLYVLGQADHFIGNCVSSFTSFVTRERNVHGKPTSFWGFS